MAHSNGPSEETLPLFNLKAVVRETGVSAPTLRMWERRYGLPRPQRTPSGRRLYSRRDIETVRWLTQRLSEGMTIGQAVALWQELEARGQDPLRVPAPSRPAPSPTGANLAGLRQAWLAAVLAFDELTADSVVNQAFALYPPETVCLEVLLQGLQEIGDLWYTGKATVSQEHFASNVAVRRLEALIQAAPPPSRPGRFLVLAPPLERHSFNLRLLTFFLRRRGWDVVYLGANVPLERLAETLQALRPHWVITAAQYLATVAGLMDLAELARAEGIPLGYGGRAFNQVPALRHHIPGYFLGEHLDEVPQRLEQWTAEGPPLLRVEPVPGLYREALGIFRLREIAIWGTVWLRLMEEGTAPDWFLEFGQEFGLHIQATLATGEMAVMDTYLSWLRGLRGERAVPKGWLPHFLSAYADALDRWMGSSAAFLAEYLRNRAQEQME
ncbi:MAG: MerR family transcriptional regulator [Anaerolineae bacterium]|nr:MerR family transcriptional regulator [Anaerolineae bacterium]MCX8067069.1 MerR family transcriptional regulator [Anaerolineae bacterium]